MIKIFSIKEIINASENILKSSKNNNNLTFKKKNNFTKETLNKKKTPKPISPLVLKSEIIDKKKIHENKKLKNLDLINPEINLEKNQQIIDELYKLFDKKIKKNTLKIIIEQQKEIKELRFNLSELRKKDYQNLRINKDLKTKISDLINNEKILNLKISQIQSELDISIEKESELKNINKYLEADLLEMKKSLNSIKEINISVENSKLKLQTRIDDLINYQTNLEDSNKINESNLLILTNTKNNLFNENEKLKSELKMMSENKEMLINNNANLQNEASLLLKNKKLLIEINDKYQKQLDQLKISQNNSQEEKTILMDKLNNIKDENQRNIENNISLKKQNNDFQHKINLIYEEKIEIEKNNKDLKEKNINLLNKVDFINQAKQQINENNIKLKNEISNFIRNENLLLNEKKDLENENSQIKKQNNQSFTGDNEKLLKNMNDNLQNELLLIKENELKLLENNKELQNEILRIKSSKVTSIEENELLNLKQKLHFHQDENLRLSHELSNSQKKYKLIKEQLNEIENEKGQISQKIDDLTSSLSKTKVITNIFKDTNVTETENDHKNKKLINIEDEIKKIFSQN
ncbi:hypothetical protein IDH19_00690 [Pelagibacterales bacterium SAG-MED48]|nr:hypothetical protein [Pelagibacterales bacterium SAG-MED48]